MITIKKLNLTIKKHHILKNINLELPGTSFVTISGRSGSGKSSLLNCILGYLKYEGEIYYNDISIKDNSLEVRKNYFGYVSQNLNLIDKYTCYENIKLALDIAGVTANQDKVIKDVLEKVKLSKYRKSKAGLLSGGEKQRLAIARAIAIDPNVIICDEPSSALDDESKEIVLNVLKEISKYSLVIISTHDIDIIDKYADRIIEIDNGNIIEDTINENSIGNIKYSTTIKVKSILKNNPINRVHYLLLTLFGILVIIMSFITTKNFSSGLDEKYDDKKAYKIIDENEEIISLDHLAVDSIINNGGSISLTDLIYGSCDYRYGTLSMDYDITNCYKTTMYNMKIDYELIDGREINQYNEIMIDKIVADSIIKELIKIGYKDASYDTLFNSDSSFEINGNIYKIVGITNMNYEGVYMHSAAMLGWTEFNHSSMFETSQYYLKENFDGKLELYNKEIDTTKCNVYSNSYSPYDDEYRRFEINVIGSIKNSNINEVVFESEEDRKRMLEGFYETENYNHTSSLFFDLCPEDVVLKSGKMPVNSNEILLPESLEDEYLAKNRDLIHDIEGYEVTGYYKINYDIIIEKAAVLYKIYASNSLIINKYNDYYQYNDDDLQYSIYGIDNIEGYNLVNYQDFANRINTNKDNFSFAVMYYSVIILMAIIYIVFYIISIINNHNVISIERSLGVSKKKIFINSNLNLTKSLLYFLIPQGLIYSLNLIFNFSNLFNGAYISLLIFILIMYIVNFIIYEVLLNKPLYKQLKNIN